MKWFIKNWFNSTIFLAVYLTILLVLFVMKENFALFLIWIQLPVYFIHEFEEYILPGGFTKFFNTKMLGSPKGDWPLTDTVSFWINGSVIFFAFPLSGVLATVFGLSFGIWCAYFSFINAFGHVVMTIRFKKYNPGFLVSLLLNIPVAVYTVYYFILNNLIPESAHIIGTLIGLAVQAVVMIYGFKVMKPKIKNN